VDRHGLEEQGMMRAWRSCLHDAAKALAHPLRARILGVLTEQVASPIELTEVLGEPMSKVAWHVQSLGAARIALGQKGSNSRRFHCTRVVGWFDQSPAPVGARA
jgi:Helix-turn-helix domain